MIPVSVSDIIKLLEEIPIWKAVASLPKRIAELEKRVQQLEAGATARPLARTGKECPICDSAMKVLLEYPHRELGPAGVMTHELKCPNCDHKSIRAFSPGKGYL
jgi:hypothetical protein